MTQPEAKSRSLVTSQMVGDWLGVELKWSGQMVRSAGAGLRLCPLITVICNCVALIFGSAFFAFNASPCLGRLMKGKHSMLHWMLAGHMQKKHSPLFRFGNSSVANGRFEDTEKTKDKVTAYGAAMIKRDQFYNEWTYDPASKSWQDEYGGRLEDPSFPRTGQLLTPDGKMWGMEFVEVWTNSAGEVQRKKPVGSQDWWQAFMPIWASSCGNITAGWPSRIWNRMQANASMVKLPSLAKYDEFFNKWTYDASQKAWFDEYGGKTFYDPKNIEIKPLVTSDGKEWRRGNRFAWVSGEGQVFLVKPDSSPDAKWKQSWPGLARATTCAWAGHPRSSRNASVRAPPWLKVLAPKPGQRISTAAPSSSG